MDIKPIITSRLFIFGLSGGLFLGGILFLIVLCFMPPHPGKSEVVRITIPQGTPASQIAVLLKEQGIIRSQWAFRLYTHFSGAENNLRAGTFDLNYTHSLRQTVADLQEQNGAASLTKITIPEGWSLTQIADLIEQKGITKKSDFMTFAYKTAKSQFQSRFRFLESLPTDNIEGYLFPDTYYFAKGTDLPTIFLMMLDQFDKKIWQLYPPNFPLSFHETVTLASIIEKEAYFKDEMPTISSVFYNRLAAQMPLGSCPTVAYALGEIGKTVILYADTQIESPYNTYRYPGLPPTPIASPGVRAFNAVLHPAQTSFYYFFARGNGEHVFSHTYQEHLSRQ